MATGALKAGIGAQPFRQFAIVLTGGHEVPVTSAERIAVSEPGHEAAVFTADQHIPPHRLAAPGQSGSGCSMKAVSGEDRETRESQESAAVPAISASFE